MATPQFNPNPKQRFLADKAGVKEFFNLTGSENLRAFLDIALAQMQWKLCSMPAAVDNPQAAYYMLAGAHEFLETFYHLGAELQVSRAEPSGQLNWKA